MMFEYETSKIDIKFLQSNMIFFKSLNLNIIYTSFITATIK